MSWFNKCKKNSSLFGLYNLKVTILMSKQKFYTPLANKKNRENEYKKEGYDDNYTTQQNKYRKNDLNYNLLMSEKIKSNPSFSLDKMSTRTIEIAKSSFIPDTKKRDLVKLPSIKLRPNPEQNHYQSSQQGREKSKATNDSKVHYVSNLYRCLKKHETTYLMNLYRQHFYQCIEVLRFGKSIKIPHPKKQLKLPKKNPTFKTIFLDMDQTLIHCDQHSNNYTVKLNFPLQRGGTLAAGIRIRPNCREFLQKLSEFAEIIIFTASSSSYADVVLDHLDPDKKLISHRLYRHHCTLQKGYYLKDLRILNRRLQDVALVDNSPYCHILQPQNAIPIVPFYHYNKDRQLQTLLDYLKIIVTAQDMRTVILNTYFWNKYVEDTNDPRKLFLKYYKQQ